MFLGKDTPHPKGTGDSVLKVLAHPLNRGSKEANFCMVKPGGRGVFLRVEKRLLY